jgi:hypothetical protein
MMPLKARLKFVIILFFPLDLITFQLIIFKFSKEDNIGVQLVVNYIETHFRSFENDGLLVRFKSSLKAMKSFLRQTNLNFTSTEFQGFDWYACHCYSFSVLFVFS